MDKTEIWIRLIDGLILIASLLVLLSLISWAQARDEEDRQATERSHAAMLAACMNGGVLIDHNTDTAYFCGKPTEIKL